MGQVDDEEDRRETEELAQIAAGLKQRMDLPEKVEKTAPKNTRRERGATQKEIDQYKEQFKADEDKPLMTLLGYSQIAGQYHTDSEVISPAMKLGGYSGKILMLLQKRRSGQTWTPQEEKEYISSIGQILYQLSSLCDQSLVSLQRIAEISLIELENDKIKKLHERK